MARIFITGSTDGLGRAAARTLLDEGHEVVLHARSQERASGLGALTARAAGVAIGDLSRIDDVTALADQVNALGRMDAVIHNAGVYLEPGRGTTPDGHAQTLAVNVLAPYLLTAWIERPDRLVYLSSGMHQGASSLDDLDWTQRRWNAARAYSESKLCVATLALTVARRWPDVLSNAVDPGWVPTRMGGPGAPDDLEQGHLTQTWLAVGKDAEAMVSGHYWHHRRHRTPDRHVADRAFQDQLMGRVAELTGVELF